ncbi:MAG TPA: sugar transferase [Sphingomonas sp.]|nr:sugar transferase [Sphingomonas sp.]
MFDVLLSVVVLVATSPVLAAAMLAVWAADGGPPLHRAVRVGRDNRNFGMFKLRTMTVGADRLGAASTSRSDARITAVGRWLRRTKLDELPQFWNVLTGDMSVVGPRPNSRRGGVDRYTAAEMRLLTVRPGITDLASIVFADEAEILDGAADPDALYDAVIRPWKSRLGLLYIDRAGLADDCRIVALTALALVARPAVLRGVAAILARWDAPDAVRRASLRCDPLVPVPAPGAVA